jgi:hypothetical protein
MDFGTTIVAVVGAVSVFGMPVFLFIAWSRHKERMAALMQPRSDMRSSAEIESLKQEIASLRDTTTQYDMSVEHRLTEIQHRLDNIEGRRTSSTAATYDAVSRDRQAQQTLTQQ